MKLIVSWNPGDTESPSLVAQLIPSQGNPIDLSFFITNGNTGTLFDNTIPAGYYTLITQLFDNNILTMGAVDIIRIIEGQITTGRFDFTEINKPEGTIGVNIIPEMNNPFDVTITGQESEITTAETMTLTASVPA